MSMRRNTLEIRKRLGTLRPCYYGERRPPPPLSRPTETLSSPTVAMSRAWSAIGTLLEALPSSIRGYVLAEVPDADWELELGAAAGLQIRWLDRRAGESWQNSRTSTVMRSTMAASSASLSLRSTTWRVRSSASSMSGALVPEAWGPQTTSSMSRRWTSVAHGMLGSNSAIPCGRNVTRCSLLPPTPSSLPSGGAREPGGRLEPMPPRLRASGCPGGRRGPGGGSASTRSCCGAAPLGWIFSETALSGPILIVITQTRKAILADAGGGG